MDRIEVLRREIEELGAQRAAKERELQQLEAGPQSLLDPIGCRKGNPAPLRPDEKIALFLELFGARRDVYTKFWENSGKKGYSPAYDNGRDAGASGRRFIPLTERVVEAHLRGHQAIGMYALRLDDSCIFLAADFDGEGWRENILRYQ